MAQINITLNQEELLEVFSNNRDVGFKILLEKILNEIMKTESKEQLKAEMHERSEERTDYRNGTRERDLNTRLGTITLKVPRHRTEPFHTMIFDNYTRSESALIATMVEMVVSGVSTRKVATVVETLCGTTYSKSMVSEVCKSLDESVYEFKNRPLNNMEIPFLMVDATYFKVRENHKSTQKAFLVALGIGNDGRREILGFEVYDTEEVYSWSTFLESLKKRGLSNVNVIISDAHTAIRKSIAKVYPECAWQRCQVHLTRNILDVSPQKYKDGIGRELNEMFHATTADEARKIKDRIVNDYQSVAEKAMELLENGFEDSMTIMCLPEHMRRRLSSTNLIERINREFKRRSDPLQVFPNSASILRLMGAVAIECSDGMSLKQPLFSANNFKLIKDDCRRKFLKIASAQLSTLGVA